MVQKFYFYPGAMVILFLATCMLAMFTAPQIGKFIGRFGERRILVLEYVGLMMVFAGYAFVETACFAAVLYILDHLFFSIVMKTYFQKIADPADIASTSGESFTINHIAAR